MRQSFILIRLKQDAPRVVRVDGRTIGLHSLHGNLHAVEKVSALRLIEAGVAKLLPHQRVDILRDEVAVLELRAAA